MTIGKAIATSALLLAIGLAGMKLAGQSFASFTHDRPFLVAPKAVDQGPPAALGIGYWWHAGDNSNGVINVWTSRVASITDSRWVSPPGGATAVATNGYVLFDNSGTWLSNFSITIPCQAGNCDVTLAMVIQNDDLSANNTLLEITNNGPGYFLRERVTEKSTLYKASPGLWASTERVYYLPVGEIYDWVEVATNNYANLVYWTNGVATTLVIDQYSFANNNEGHIIGYCLANSWSSKFKLYDLMIFTNRWDSTSVSNFHRWRTNTYGGSI